MLNEIKQIRNNAVQLCNEAEVERALDKMALAISEQLKDHNPLLLCALNGGIVTFGKLLTRFDFPLTVDAINASRYRNKTSGSDVQWLLKPNSEINDRSVLIIDDILDEGYTLEAIINYCQEQGAESVYTAVLVDKQIPQPKPVVADFVGLVIENYYLFGYGMDYKGYLRNAPGIFACKDV